VSLEDCVQSALEKNLDVRIARYNPPEALADLQAAYAGYNPVFNLGGAHNYSKSGGGFDPTLGILTLPNSADQNSFNSSLTGLGPMGFNYKLQGNLSEQYGTAGGSQSFDNSSASTTLSMSQPLLKNFWIDQTRLNIQVGKNRVKYTDLGLKQTVMNLATAVEQAYYDLIYTRENVTVQAKAVELAMQLVAENKKRVEVGSLAPLDERQAEAQAASSQAALIAAKSALITQENTVKQLISDNFAALQPVDLQPTAPLTSPVRVFDRQISWSKGLTDRPDLLQAKLDVQRQGITIKYNYNQLFPELDITGGYGLSANVPRGDLRDAENQIVQGNLPSHSYGGQLTYRSAIPARAPSIRRASWPWSNCCSILRSSNRPSWSRLITTLPRRSPATSRWPPLGPRGSMPRRLWRPSRRSWRTARARPTPSCRCSGTLPPHAATRFKRWQTTTRPWLSSVWMRALPCSGLASTLR